MSKAEQKQVTETKDKKFFEETSLTLAKKQNELRDEYLENVLKGSFDVAEKNYKELQTVSIGIQLCQQSIARENDRAAGEERRKMAEAEQKLAEETLKEMAEAEAKKSKGFLSFFKGGK